MRSGPRRYETPLVDEAADELLRVTCRYRHSFISLRPGRLSIHASLRPSFDTRANRFIPRFIPLSSRTSLSTSRRAPRPRIVRNPHGRLHVGSRSSPMSSRTRGAAGNHHSLVLRRTASDSAPNLAAPFPPPLLCSHRPSPLFIPHFACSHRASGLPKPLVACSQKTESLFDPPPRL